MEIQNKAGFTLLEVIAVLVVLSVVTVVFAARLMDTGAELVAATDVIKTHLRYAQSRAMSDNQIWGIFCTGTKYWLYKGGNINDKVILPGEKVDTIDITVYTDEEPIWRSISAIEGFTISYDDWGIPYVNPGAGSKLGSGHQYSQITVWSGSNSATITITPNTGFIP
jgi:MSHA pilin protein MshC